MSRPLACGIAVALAVACTPLPAVPPAERTAPSAASAGRILGAEVGLEEYAALCAAGFPAQRAGVTRAFDHWQWRNGAIVREVRDAFWRSLRDAGEPESAIEVSRRYLDGEFERIRADLREAFLARTDAEQTAECEALPVRLDAGRLDLRRKYPVEVEAWLGGRR